MSRVRVGRRCRCGKPAKEKYLAIISVSPGEYDAVHLLYFCSLECTRAATDHFVLDNDNYKHAEESR